MSIVDVYAPWAESEDSLIGRHVGREGEIELLDQRVARFVSTQDAAHTYLLGRPGIGKSHLLALLHHRIVSSGQVSKIRLALVPQVAPACRRASDLFALIGRLVRSDDARSDEVAECPLVLLFDGLDTQLAAMDQDERHEVRARLFDGDRPVLVVATGTVHGKELTAADEPLFGALKPMLLAPLDARDSRDLFARTGGREPVAVGTPSQHRRDDAAVLLAHGLPRLLVLLGVMQARRPGSDLATAMGWSLSYLAGQYRQELRALAPMNQRIVETLASSPRSLSPTQLAATLEETPTATSVACSRMAYNGTLVRNSAGRRVYYRIVDPLFRYWLEQRMTPWEESRTCKVARLLEGDEGATIPPDEGLLEELEAKPPCGELYPELETLCTLYGRPISYELRFERGADRTRAELLRFAPEGGFHIKFEHPNESAFAVALGVLVRLAEAGGELVPPVELARQLGPFGEESLPGIVGEFNRDMEKYGFDGIETVAGQGYRFSRKIRIVELD
jgi:hypothetical protein